MALSDRGVLIRRGAVYQMDTNGADNRSVVFVTALGIVSLTTLLVLSGLRGSNLANTITVSFVFVGIVAFLFTAFRSVPDVDRITRAFPRPNGIRLTIRIPLPETKSQWLPGRAMIPGAADHHLQIAYHSKTVRSDIVL